MHIHASRLLTASEGLDYIISNASLEVESPALGKMSNQFYSILAQKAETGSECVDIIKNASDNCGAEAWRRLCKRFCGHTADREVHLTRIVVNPGKPKKVDDILAHIEK